MNDESPKAPPTRYDMMTTFDKLFVTASHDSLIGTPDAYAKSKDAMRNFVWQLILNTEKPVDD